MNQNYNALDTDMDICNQKENKRFWQAGLRSICNNTKMIFLAIAILGLLSVQKTQAQAGSGCNGGNEFGTYNNTGFSPGYILGTMMTLPNAGTLTGLSMRGTATGSKVKMALYANNAGAPGALLTTSSVATIVNGTNTMPVTPINLAAGNYFVMAIYDVDGPNAYSVVGASSKTTYYTATPFNSPLPASGAGFTSYTGYDYQYWMNVTCPIINSFTPLSLCSGAATAITIIGTGFTGATAVKIGGVDVTSFVVNSATQITAQASGNNVGAITVTTPGATATSATNLLFNTIPATQIVTPGGTTTNCSGPVLLSRESNEVVDSDFTAMNNPTYGQDQWQTFVPNVSGPMNSLLVNVNGSVAVGATLTIYAGSGIGGTVLYNQGVTVSGINQWLQFMVPNIILTAGSTYTFRFSNGGTLNFNGENGSGSTYYSNTYGFRTNYRLSFRTTMKPNYASYQWYKNGVAIAGATTSTYSAASSGNYTVSGKFGNCFSAASNTATINGTPNVTCPSNQSLSAPVGACSAMVVYTPGMTDSSTATYAFTGATVKSGTGSGSGSRFNIGVTTVTITSIEPCGQSSCSFTITVTGSPNTAIATPATICLGQSSVLSPGVINSEGSMLTLNGSSYLQLNNLNISPAPVPTLTASVWVKRTGGSGNYQAIISNDDGGYDRALMVLPDGNYHIFAGRDINTGIASTLNQWDFISVYWSATAVTMWKNGIQVYTTSGENASSSGNTTLIGRNFSSGFYFVGSVDQLSFWNTARTSAQLLAERMTYLLGNEAGLLAYYKLDEGSGTTTIDATVTARIGSLSGATWEDATEPSFTYLWSPGGSTLASPTVNPTATTTYTVTVTNARGCASTSAGTTVTVNTPGISCITNQTANTTAGTCSVVVTYAAPTVTGNPLPTYAYVFSGATTGSGSGSGSGATFNKGVTTVTLTATNTCGTANCSFTVTVTDNINPTITAPANISSCPGAPIVIGTPITADNCGVASVTNNAPTTYPVGITTVTWTVTDTSGRTATATQTVTIIVSVTATAATATPSVLCSTSSAVLGVTVTNNSGNMLTFSGSARAQVSNLNISPSIIPALTVSAWAKRTGAISSWSAIVSNDDGGFDRAIMINSDGNYHIFAGRDINTGIPSVLNQWDFITVYWSATAVTMSKNGVQVFATTAESASSSATGTGFGRSSVGNYQFNGSIDQVSLWNTTRSQTQLLSEMSTYLTGSESGLVGYYKFDEGSGSTTADATINARTASLLNSPVWEAATEPAVSYLWSPGGSTLASPTVSPTTTTIYTVTVTNAAGCSATSSGITVTVDRPIINCIANQTANTAAGTCIAVVNYAAPTVTGNPLPTYTYVFSGATTGSGSGSGTGSTFNKGVTTVTLTATNSCGSTNCSFTVTVTDNINPTITAPANISVCQGATIVLGTPITADNCGVASVTNNAPGLFPAGTTSVTWTVTDTSGRTATAIQLVTNEALPQPPLTTATPTTVCPGDSSNLQTGIVTNGFSGFYAPSNWTNVNPSIGYVDTGNAPNSITLHCGENGINGPTIFSRGILSTTSDITISFNWNYSIGNFSDGNTFLFCQVGTDAPLFNGYTPYAGNQSGTATFVVPAGQIFTIGVYSNSGSAFITMAISNFSASVVNAPGTVVNWYTAPTGGTSIGSSAIGANFPVSPPSAGINSYYAETVSANGCISANRSLVTVNVDTALTINCVGNQTANASPGICGANVAYANPTSAIEALTFNYTFNGATSGSGNGTGSGSIFNVGITTVTIIANSHCASAQCSFTVTVLDAISPTISAPANVTSCMGTEINLGNPVTIDNCGITSVTNNAPASYPLGTTQIVWTATDLSGNTATAIQTVTMQALPQAPVVAATPTTVCLGQSSNLNASATTVGFSGFYAPANWTIANGPGGIVNTALAPGSISMTSGTQMGAGATDFSRGVLSATMDLTITFNWSHTSTDGPQYDYPQYVINGIAYIMQGYSVSGTQAQSGTASIVVPAGQTFALRAYTTDGVYGGCTVVYSNFVASNSGTINWFTAAVGGTSIGSSASGSNFMVIPTATGINSYYAEQVNSSGCSSDRTLVTVTVGTPTISCIANQTANTGLGICSAVVTYDDSATTGTPAPALSYVFDGATIGSGSGTGSGSTFNKGITTVTITANNSCGSANCSFTVAVSDTVAPVITAPTAINTPTNTACSATGVDLGLPTATDNCALASVTNNAPAVFPVGNTTVVWTAMDSSGNSATANQTVIVTDNIDPTITAPATVNASTNTACTATGVSLGTPVTADNCGVASVTNNAPIAFPLGTTIVKWTVVDANGNIATADQSVTVTDNIVPTVTAPADVATCHGVAVVLGSPVVADNCSISAITNDAPAEYPIGITTVTWIVTDASGNTATATQMVTVSENAIYYADADNDGYGSATNTILTCVQPIGYVTNNTDCNDAVAAINPGHAEVLYNGFDDNCDGQFDEGAQYTSQVQDAQCASTLSTINSFIVVYSKPNVTFHRFEVTDLETGAIQILERYQNYFSPTMLAYYDYARTYSVRVMLQRNGIWLGYYGPSCLVSTPAVLVAGGAATISPSQCGNTIATISTLIATTSLPNVTGYRFRITNATDPSAPNQIQVIDRAQFNWFALTMLATYNYGTTYLVEVSIRTNGVYSAYGSPCAVSAPAVPTLAACGTTIATKGTLVSVASKDRVTSYRFAITNMLNGQVTTLDRSQNWFTFNNVPGFVSGGEYGVSVAVMTSGVYSPFSEACIITAPAAARTVDVGSMFDAKAYPNPFAEHFMISVSTASETNFTVKVYDMAGRLIESKAASLLEMQMLQTGDGYPAGVYNVILMQGENVKILRVIKR